jgi:hypothetical protein
VCTQLGFARLLLHITHASAVVVGLGFRMNSRAHRWLSFQRDAWTTIPACGRNCTFTWIARPRGTPSPMGCRSWTDSHFKSRVRSLDGPRCAGACCLHDREEDREPKRAIKQPLAPQQREKRACNAIVRRFAVSATARGLARRLGSSCRPSAGTHRCRDATRRRPSGPYGARTLPCPGLRSRQCSRRVSAP